MNTKILTISDVLANAKELELAGSIIRNGGLVAFPTETVYGLGGNALDSGASARIYSAKGRPQDNPLIVHICDISQLDDLCHDIPNEARRLAEVYWPGPLTMILPKRDIIPDATTAGLDTAGIRMPSHEIARALIKAAGVPIAAPSANLSGKPSTTSFEHVFRDMNGRIDAIIDGGTSDVGLESTVVEFDQGFARILRPGFITLEDIEAVLGKGKCLVASGVREHVADGEKVRSPGMKYRHYAPSAPVTAICGDSFDVFREMRRRTRGESNCAAIICDEYASRLTCKTISCGKSGDYVSMAHRLFDALRSLDCDDISFILAQCPNENGLGMAIANRLKRAAAFNVVTARHLFVLGLTGATGSGKSVAADLFTAQGARVIDCDQLYHKMLSDDKEMLNAVEKTFPCAFRNGMLDRKALGSIVFADKSMLDLLNTTVLPFVVKKIESIIDCCERSGEHTLVLDAPTLFESGADRLCDEIIAVTAPEEIRLSRICQRDGISREYAEMRVKGGKNDEYYNARCDKVFINAGNFDNFKAQIIKYMEKYLCGGK